MLDKTATAVVYNTKTCGKSHALAVGCSDKSSGQTPQERIEMKAPITHAQAWAAIAESSGWDVARKLEQSQAERIAELERESETHSKVYGLAIVERDALRAELGDLPEAQAEMLAEIKQLRTQLAEIGEAEPVAWFAFADSNGPVPLELFGWDEKACKHAVLTYARAGNWKGTVEGYLMQQGWTLKPLFTRPMPAQDVTELVEALEEYGRAGVGNSTDWRVQLSALRLATAALSKYKGAK